MRINSLGLYTNRGLIQGNIQPQNIEPPRLKPVKTLNPSELKSDIEKAGNIVSPAVLSSAESAQIKKLFGHFDISVLTEQYQKEINNRALDKNAHPGRFVDIIV